MLCCEQLETRDTPSTVTLSEGVLTITNGPYGSSTQIYAINSTQIQVYNSAAESGPRTFTFNKADVRQIVWTGGANTDSYWNGTDISEVAFGGAGNDSIVTGTGASSFVDAGSGQDFVIFQAQSGVVNAQDGERDYLYVAHPVSTVILFDPGVDVIL